MKGRFAKYAWFVLAYNIAVVLWGAFVRATGSGAGCGEHWPLCNGEVVPRAPKIATIIEFGHRITSGLVLILVILLVIFAYRRFPAKHIVRRTATLSLAFTISEALIGAALVLLGHVATNTSVWRGATLSIHLVNTLVLLASLALTAWFASPKTFKQPRLRLPSGFALLWGLRPVLSWLWEYPAQLRLWAIRCSRHLRFQRVFAGISRHPHICFCGCVSYIR